MAPSKIFFFLVISFFAYSTSNAANHYVDKNASGNNNGTSWVNAWQSFAAINWSSVEPGDIVYISGGTDSTVYYEKLRIVNVLGTVDNPITIRNSWESGHNGRVIIDGQNKTRREGIWIGEGPADYLTFKGIEIRDHTINIWVHNGWMNGLVFDSLLITDWTFAGIFTQGLTNNHESINGVTIQNCDLISGTEHSADALQFNSSSNHIIRNNFIHMRNSQWDNDHVDGMLALWSAGFRVYNNICVLDSNAQGQPYILRARADATDEDSVIVYNNLWYQGGIWNSNEYNWTTNFYIRYNEEGYERPPMYVAHNTIIIWGPTAQGVHFETGATLENNIIAAFGDGVQGPRPGGGNYQWLSQIRGNQPVDSIKQCLIWREWGDGYTPAKMLTGYFTGNGTGIEKPSWSQWVNVLGGTGINSDPLFVEDFSGRHSDQANMTGELQTGSPCRNAGNDIQDLVENKLGLDWVGIGVKNPDGLGVLPGTIPRDSSPDLGAYEYVSRGPDLIPPDVTGATLLDSITLKINFSEPLDPSTAQNPNNYSINNGITVVSALLTGSVVTLTTSPHSNGTYTVTVSNVEDIAGNIVSPTANSADYEWTVIQDLTPPEVTGATLLDSVTLKIMFSELLDETTAEDESNYSISNNIDIFNASLSGSEVTLQTSTHFPGSYIVTVVNVEDLAGNPIAQSNTADYEWTVIQDITPPELIGVQIVEADKVVLDFSEPLDASQVSNVGNYIISEQMQVLGAELNTTQTRICLTTDEHLIEHIYTIEINNLTDLSGNVISSEANSSFYKKLDIGAPGYIEHLIECVDASATTDTNTSPQKTLDGLVNGDPDPDSRWAAEIMPQWIQFDLGAITDINLIAISFYNWNNGRIYEYSIQISNDENNWNEIVSSASSSNQEWTFNDFSAVISARYVRIICESNNQANWAGLWEARIFEPDYPTSVETEPRTYALKQNYPNPFNPSTTISYSIPASLFVTLKVYDVLGNEIATLVNANKPVGSYQVKFDAVSLPSGIYFYRLQAGSFVETKKMILMK